MKSYKTKYQKRFLILVNQDNTLVDIYKLPTAEKDSIFQLLIEIYENHLNRNVTEAENVILLHALHILFYRCTLKHLAQYVRCDTNFYATLKRSNDFRF